MDVASLRDAAGFPLDEAAVSGCLDERRPGDRVFARAWRGSLRELAPGERRGALAGITGHVAESVTAVVFAELGYQPVWHFAGPGRHGVDLLMLCPALERLLAIEVKGTCNRGCWPRFRRGEIGQISLDWLDKRDPGMAEWGLEGRDVYGPAVLVDFAEMRLEVGPT